MKRINSSPQIEKNTLKKKTTIISLFFDHSDNIPIFVHYLKTLIHSIKMKTCKDFVAIALLALGSLSGCNNTSALIGEWTEPIPGMENMIQGFKLEEGGKASSINMATLKYKTWEQQGDLLILTGESIGNGQTISFSDTLTIKKATQNELTIQDRNIEKTYTRQK